METVSEGTEGGTGMVRWVMWGMAMELWTHYPIFGIGAANFGVLASLILPDDPNRPVFQTMNLIWGQQLHNTFVQILCEEGLVGAGLFIWMSVGFYRRGRALRTPAAIAEWRRKGGRVDLPLLSLALELGMVGWMLNSFFYNQLYVHWYWTLLMLNLALDRCTQPGAAGSPSRSRPTRPAAGPEAPSDAPAPVASAPASLGAALARPGR
jgi:O-antigen ligase